MALPLSFHSVSIADYTMKSNGEPETTSFVVPIITLTPANVAANETLCGNLRTAIQAVILGNQYQNEITYVKNVSAKTPAASALAQRENKWLLRYHDATTGQKAQVSIGTADLTELAGNSEFLSLAAGNGLALKTAFEAIVVSPFNSSNAVVLDSVQFVGRNT